MSGIRESAIYREMARSKCDHSQACSNLAKRGAAKRRQGKARQTQRERWQREQAERAQQMRERRPDLYD